jgi:hypothetical protein
VSEVPRALFFPLFFYFPVRFLDDMKQESNPYDLRFHRDDLGLKWDEVSAAFNAYFPQDRRRHGLQGIQGRYYRILKDEGVPKLRMRQKKRPRRDYGVIARTSRRYPWMKQD